VVALTERIPASRAVAQLTGSGVAAWKKGQQGACQTEELDL